MNYERFLDRMEREITEGKVATRTTEPRKLTTSLVAQLAKNGTIIKTRDMIYLGEERE